MRFLALLCCFTALPAHAQWTQLGGPEPPNAFAFAESEGILFLGTNESDTGDAYWSSDGGQQWAHAGLPPNNGGTLAAYADDGVFYAGTYISGLYRWAEDAWTNVPDLNTTVSAIAGDGDLLFAGLGFFSSAPLARSTDGGLSWTVLTGPDDPTVETHDLFVRGNLVLVGGQGEAALHRSTDGGTTWTTPGPFASGIQRIGAFASDGEAIYASSSYDGQTLTSLYRSLDDGATWTFVGQIFDDLPVEAASGLSVRGSVVVATFADDVFGPGEGSVQRSADGGVTWSAVTTGLPDDALFFALHESGDALFVGTTEGVFRSDDTGLTWTASGQGTAAVRGVSTLHVAGESLLVGLTTNGGGGQGLWTTGDLGATWLPVENGLNDRADLWSILDDGGRLYAANVGFPRGVYASDDGGLSWSGPGAGMDNMSLVFDLVAHDGALYAGAFEGVYRSDDGATWTLTTSLGNVFQIASFGGALYAGTNGEGVFRSDDGTTWMPVNTGLDDDLDRHIHDLEAHAGTLYLTNNNGLFRFDGTAWTLVGLAEEHPGPIFSLEGYLAVGTAFDEYVYVRPDSGAWQAFSEGYAGGEVYELAAVSGHLVIGSRSHGLWSRSLGDLFPTSAEDRAPPERTAYAVYPNPVQGRDATLHLGSARAQVQLFDRLGRLLWSHAGASETLQLPTRALAAGLYFVRLTVSDQARTLPLTVVR